MGCWILTGTLKNIEDYRGMKRMSSAALVVSPDDKSELFPSRWAANQNRLLTMVLLQQPMGMNQTRLKPSADIAAQASQGGTEDKQASDGAENVEEATQRARRQSVDNATHSSERANVHQLQLDAFRFQCWCWYALSVIILIAYAVVCELFASDNINQTGIMVAVACIVVDIICFINVVSGRFRRPLVVVTILTTCRAFFFVFGAYYWMIGFSIVYFVLNIVFGDSCVDYFVPLRSPQDRQRVMMETLTGSQVNGSQPAVPVLATNQPAESVGGGCWGVFDRCCLGVRGSWVMAYSDLFVVTLLNLSFLAAIISNYFIDTLKLGFIPLVSSAYQQWTIGVIVLFLSSVVVGLRLTSRLYHNNGADSKCLSCYTAVSVVLIGFGIFINSIFSVVLVLVLCIFLPPLIAVFIAVYSAYRDNGFEALSHPSKRTPAYLSFWSAFWSGGLPFQDYWTLLGVIVWPVLMAGSGWAMAKYHSPSWVGYTIACSMFIVTTTLVPFLDFINRGEVTFNFVVQLVASFMALVGMVVAIFFSQLEANVYDTYSLVLLFVLCIYPTVAIVCTSYTLVNLSVGG